jgi:hypothetical protein
MIVFIGQFQHARTLQRHVGISKLRVSRRLATREPGVVLESPWIPMGIISIR